ncbi:hypothetical protein Vafri_21076 [Volvox africanus]|uniref:FAM192A/Fyv6 N-terminal domain-containing protein n=1 Tax=Volvox africanus TaxID=51714 RepID=A0A8J4BYE5_9CHLO|nr:hypothetical protein Vafri_21076 [Volvox africanus]
MMTEERRVDMLRLVGEERYYDREELFGRDATSVFPSLVRQQQQQEAAAGGLAAEAVMEALGARKFISESELETIRATRGVTVDDGAVAVDKPLAEILRERKAAKEAEHEDKWKQMKIGKNRPLDADELQFLDSVAAAEAEKERAWSEMERAELEAFKAAVRERSVEPEGAPGPAPQLTGPALKTDPRVPSAVTASVGPAGTLAQPKQILKPLVKVKPKAVKEAAVKDPPATAGNAASAVTTSATPGSTQFTVKSGEYPSKKAKTEDYSGSGDVGTAENGRVIRGVVGTAGAPGVPEAVPGGQEALRGGGGNGRDEESVGAHDNDRGTLAALMGGYGSDVDSEVS